MEEHGNWEWSPEHDLHWFEVILCELELATQGSVHELVCAMELYHKSMFCIGLQF